MPEVALSDWEHFLRENTDAHILQTSSWGRLKSSFGWKIHYMIIGDFGAQVLFRSLPGGFSFAYIPKGPIVTSQYNSLNGGHWKKFISDPHWLVFWREIDLLCLENRAIFLKVEPDIWKPSQELNELFVPDGFCLSKHPIQPIQTILIDLSDEEDVILNRMKQKTRYNIRLAKKKGVTIDTSRDIEQFYRLMVDTGRRDHFQVHSRSYYQLAYDLFHPLNECELLFAYHAGEALAGLMLFRHGKRAWFFYGGSTNKLREFMPSYFLQWEAMRWARSRGCMQYDMWGIPDLDETILEDNFLKRNDGLWGVYRFKRGFGGVVKRTIGPWDRIYNRPLYTLYSIWKSRVN